MTTASANKTPAAKSTQTKPTNSTPTEVKSEEVAKPVEETKPETNRIPEVLRSNTILEDFCKQYLSILMEITDYNKAVLAEKNSEWPVAKILEKSRELGNPTDANVKPNDEIKKALDEFEAAAAAHVKARKAVIETTAKALGVTLTSVADRDVSVEAPLKEKRKVGIELGNQLSAIAKMTTQAEATAAVNEFLENNPMPAVGRDQVRTFGDDTKSTPKYRLTITVRDSDGNVKLEEKGFTKTAQGLTKFYPRGEALKADKLREAWEAAGNSPDKTVTNPVEFEDNNLHFTIFKNS